MSLYLDRGTFGIFPARICKGLPTADQMVLTWLWFHSNTDTGECWPSVKTLCVETGLKRSTLFTVLKRLASAGLIDRKPRFTEGMQRSNMYRVIQNPLFAGVQDVYPGVQPVDGRSPADEHKGVHQMDTEPKSLNQNQEGEEKTTPTGGSFFDDDLPY